MTARRVLLGTVGVDSGQLLVMDPCYIESEWIPRDQALAVSVRFWGEDAPRAARWVRRAFPTARVTRIRPTLYHATFAPPDADDLTRLQAALADHAAAAGWLVTATVARQSTYDRVCAATDGPNHGGGIPYRRGHDGLAVAFAAGLGDGTYAVYATLVDCGAWGERVAKVDIELLSDAEIAALAASPPS